MISCFVLYKLGRQLKSSLYENVCHTYVLTQSSKCHFSSFHGDLTSLSVQEKFFHANWAVICFCFV